MGGHGHRNARIVAALVLAAAATVLATVPALQGAMLVRDAGTDAPAASSLSHGRIVVGRVVAVRRDGDLVVLRVVPHNGGAFDALLSPSARLVLPGGAAASARLLGGGDAGRAVQLHLDPDGTIVAVTALGP